MGPARSIEGGILLNEPVFKDNEKRYLDEYFNHDAKKTIEFIGIETEQTDY